MQAFAVLLSMNLELMTDPNTSTFDDKFDSSGSHAARNLSWTFSLMGPAQMLDVIETDLLCVANKQPFYTCSYSVSHVSCFPVVN